MSSSNYQNGDSASTYKPPRYNNPIDNDDLDDSPPPQRYYPPQTPSQTPSQPPRQYPASPYPTNQQQYSQQYYQQQQHQQYPAQYPPQYQGGPHHPMQYPQQYPPQYPPGQYPPGQYPPQQYPGGYPAQQRPGMFPPGFVPPQPVNPDYGQPPIQRGFFSNLFDGIFASSMGNLIIAPFIKARKMLSIRPETHPGEKFQRYMYGLPQLLRQSGVAALWKDMGSHIGRVPAQTFDLVFFFMLKNIVYPQSSTMPVDASWFSNVFLAGLGTSMRYFVSQPLEDALGRVSSYQSGAKGYINEIKNNLKNRYQNKGFKGLYGNTGTNLPTLMLYRGLQLGTIETSMEEIKYGEGHTSLFRKFLLCFSYTILARFVMYPLELAREKGIDEGSTKKNLKKMFERAKGTLKGAGMDYLRVATSRSFQASTSAMTFAIFYHLRDDATGPRY